jgi:hypothetical protein
MGRTHVTQSYDTQFYLIHHALLAGFLGYTTIPQTHAGNKATVFSPYGSINNPALKRYPASETISAIAGGPGVELCALFRRDETPANHQNMPDRPQNDVMRTVEAVFRAYFVSRGGVYNVIKRHNSDKKSTTSP